ncbi:MAG: hypothetical protein J6Q65_08635, partial [Lentisphaeria bacterium]|nr:hypothetical protein [Lentisphaeria bacterium]
SDHKDMERLLKQNKNVAQSGSGAEILDKIDKVRSELQAFLDKWESYEKTEKEQKHYDNVRKALQRFDRLRDMYAM